MSSDKIAEVCGLTSSCSVRVVTVNFVTPSGPINLLKADLVRPLSLRMVERLHDGLNIPYESLLAKVS